MAGDSGMGECFAGRGDFRLLFALPGPGAEDFPAPFDLGNEVFGVVGSLLADDGVARTDGGF